MFQYNKYEVPNTFSNFFMVYPSHGYMARQKSDLIPQFHHLQRGQRFIKYKRTKTWNSNSVDMKDIHTFGSFKRNLNFAYRV